MRAHGQPNPTLKELRDTLRVIGIERLEQLEYLDGRGALEIIVDVAANAYMAGLARAFLPGVN